MKLKTQFIITVFLFSIILAVITASAIITNRQTERVMDQERRTLDIAQGASELSYLANDYLIYRESLQLKRWQKRVASFSAQVAGLHVDTSEEQALVANIQANQSRLKEVFDSVSAQDSLSRNKRGVIDLPSLHVSWSRMAVQIRGLISDASRLSQLLRQQRDQLTYRRTMLIYVIVVLFGLFLLAGYILIYRRVLKSIATLRDSAAVIGSGNLDFIIKETKDDEIGELSRAFNQMTVNLKTLTASRAQLEKEIIERQKAEEKTRKDAILLNEAGKIAKLGGWEIDVTSMTQTWTDETYTIHDVDKETYNPNVDREISTFSPESKPLIEKAVYDAINYGKSYDLELEIITVKGSRKMTRAIGSAEIENGKTKRVYGIFQDITRQKQIQEALAESEEKYRNLVKYAPAAIYEMDLPGTAFLSVNEVMCDILGYSSEELLAMRPADLLDPEDRPLFKERIKRKLAGERIDESTEYRIRRKDGKWIDVAVNVSAFSHTEKNALRVAVIAYDITERKRAELALQERTRQMEDANRELESFSYSVSHDLRAPLRAIDGYSRMLLKKYADELSSDPVRMLTAIRSNTEKMGRLIDDLLSFSRVQKSGMNSSAIDMGRLVEEVWDEILTANKQRELELKAAEIFPAYGDSTLIRQVLSNLFSNAVKFTKDRKPGIIEITSYNDFGKNVYCLRDNGAGFDMADSNKLFGVFQRLHRSEEYEGTGVGLAIVQRIVQRHGGRVWAEGEVNRGAAFYFTLPSGELILKQS